LTNLVQLDLSVGMVAVLQSNFYKTMTGLENLLKLYIPLVAWVGLGIGLGYKLPREIATYLGKFLFWFGVPLSIMTFLRQADLSLSIWIAPVACWVAILLGAGLAWSWLKGQMYLERVGLRRSPLKPLVQSISAARQPAPMESRETETSPAQAIHLPPVLERHRCLNRLANLAFTQRPQNRPTQGSFLLSAMVGNTGYLGYPITLALVGPKYFGWAVFYDTLGSTLGAYGLGVVLAAHFGRATQPRQLLQALVNNPALWSFCLGLACRHLPLPPVLEQGLKTCAWGVIALSLLLLGMRLSQITSWRSLQQATVSLSIKMLIVPLMVGVGLTVLGVTGFPHLVIVLQTAMPPAFATLVIAEAYDLDRDLTVTTLALGSLVLLFMLPIWLWLFPA
jgi:predicted permease